MTEKNGGVDTFCVNPYWAMKQIDERVLPGQSNIWGTYIPSKLEDL